MPSIEITTAHNIVVSHELASVGQRIVAAIIDGIIVYLYALIVGLVVGESYALLMLFIFPVVWMYHFGMEVYNEGQSIGKKLLKIRVVSVEGMAPTTQEYFMRWIFRMIDITLSFGSLAILTSATSARRQRFGDIMARTTVINLKASRQFDLDKIRKLDRDATEISYPTVAQYADSDMLLVKQTLIRHQNNPSDATKELILDLRNRVVDDLGLDLQEVRKIRATKFLKKVLQDYIVLTR